MVTDQIGVDSEAVSGEDVLLLKCEITTKNTLLSGHGGPAGSASATERKCFRPVDGTRQKKLLQMRRRKHFVQVRVTPQVIGFLCGWDSLERSCRHTSLNVLSHPFDSTVAQALGEFQ